MKRVAALCAVIGAMSIALMTAPGASASGWTCSWGNPWYGPTSYCVTLNSSGNWVYSVSGSFSGSAEITNWYITAEFFDLSWHWYQTLYSGWHGGWATGGGDSIWINHYKYTGYMCSTLHYVIAGGSARTMSACLRVG